MKEIKGNFEGALLNMLSRLTLSEYSKSQVLAHWDSERGNDWFTGTLKDSPEKVLKGEVLTQEEVGL